MFFHFKQFLFTSRLTIDSQVHHVLSVPRGERGVLADVGGLVRESKQGEGDGGVFQGRSSSPHRGVLEGDTVPVGRCHRHAQRWVGDRHVLLRAIDQFLPGYLEK